MSLKQALKITLLIVILVEEIKSAIKKDYKIKLTVDSSEIIKKINNVKCGLKTLEQTF